MSLEQVDRLRAMLLARRGQMVPLDQRRAGFEAQFAGKPLPEDVTTESVDLGNGLTGLWVDHAEGRRDRALLWLHGGAFVLGSSASFRDFGARVARASGVRVLLLDYALAPEHPFPAGRNDAVAALDWLAQQGFAPAQLAIGGDSAGGNLALAALQARAARGADPLGALWLISPYLDLTHSGESVVTRAAIDPFIDPAGMPATAATYLAGHDPADPAASPLFGPMTGLPSALIQVGSDEVLYDDATRLAERLPDATFQPWIGMVHAWPLFAATIDEGDWAIGQGGSFLRRQLL